MLGLAVRYIRDPIIDQYSVWSTNSPFGSGVNSGLSGIRVEAVFESLNLNFSSMFSTYLPCHFTELILNLSSLLHRTLCIALCWSTWKWCRLRRFQRQSNLHPLSWWITSDRSFHLCIGLSKLYHGKPTNMLPIEPIKLVASIFGSQHVLFSVYIFKNVIWSQN